MTTQTIAVIGSNVLPDTLARQLAQSGFAIQIFPSLATCVRDAEKQKVEVIVLGLQRLTGFALRRIKRISLEPSFILVDESPEGPLPNPDDVGTVMLVEPSADFHTWLFTIGQAANDYRRRQRLRFLRRHFSQAPNLHPHPAIDLLANLMHSLASTDSLPSLLRALQPLAQAIPFHQLVISSTAELGLNQAYLWTKDDDTQNLTVSKDFLTASEQLSLNKATRINIGSTLGKSLQALLTQPWQSALAMSFEVTQTFPNAPQLTRYTLFFVRNSFDLFTDDERWLMEFAYAPIATTLEKIFHLQSLNAKIVDWRTTFDAISEPIAIVDRNFKIIRANQAFAGAAGGRTRTFSGSPCFTIFARRRSPCPRCPLLTSPKVRGEAPSAPHQVKNIAGQRFEVWSYDLRWSKADFRIHFYRNISKQSQLTAALLQSEKMAALGKLVLSIAHEINNPLAGLLAKAQIALHDPSTPSIAIEDLREILTAAHRARQIIHGLMGFGGELIDRDLPVGDAVESSLKFAKVALRNIKLEVNVLESRTLKGAFVSWFQQILFNLVTNAAHAMPQGGSMQVALSTSDGFCELEVRDSGKGMTKERLSRIFEPFITDKQIGSGTGLGLFIVRSLVAKVGGEIRVESAVGKGTCFYLRFPKMIFVEDNNAGDSNCR